MSLVPLHSTPNRVPSARPYVRESQAQRFHLIPSHPIPSGVQIPFLFLIFPVPFPSPSTPLAPAVPRPFFHKRSGPATAPLPSLQPPLASAASSSALVAYRALSNQSQQLLQARQAPLVDMTMFPSIPIDSHLYGKEVYVFISPNGKMGMKCLDQDRRVDTLALPSSTTSLSKAAASQFPEERKVSPLSPLSHHSNLRPSAQPFVPKSLPITPSPAAQPKAPDPTPPPPSGPSAPSSKKSSGPALQGNRKMRRQHLQAGLHQASEPQKNGSATPSKAPTKPQSAPAARCEDAKQSFQKGDPFELEALKRIINTISSMGRPTSRVLNLATKIQEWCQGRSNLNEKELNSLFQTYTSLSKDEKIQALAQLQIFICSKICQLGKKSPSSGYGVDLGGYSLNIHKMLLTYFPSEIAQNRALSKTLSTFFSLCLTDDDAYSYVVEEIKNDLENLTDKELEVFAKAVVHVLSNEWKFPTRRS